MTICEKKRPVVDSCDPESGEYTSPIVAPRWLSMKFPTFSATQNGTAEKNPIRNPTTTSFTPTTASIPQPGSPGGIVASTCGTASTANARIATRRAVPMIIASPNAGQTMNAAPMRTAARASAMIRRWYSR